ncbi:hypothetical protein GYMLUDRAFT_230714 [Collybiopsis luxurians FD-317 M1]|uniref:Cytochrome P450 n=1 Tax=Collybiopsis luxurians FD-317 M1 TaxID=944289 RepID=A0A0D0C057_9AGAR|nr:hypothetical protein GYMLUDRAFT_230714 [Collybiopsis luxurians FD-317 M1]
MALFGIIALLVFPLLFTLYLHRTKSSHPLPPGPKKLPLVGNLFKLPYKGQLWLEYSEMCQKYSSDIIHFSGFGKSILIVNSTKVASDLFERRSSIYSSRPQTVMIGELMGFRDNLTFRVYDEGWKIQRKLMNKALQPNDVSRFHSKLLFSTHDLLRVLAKSNDITKDLHSWTAVLMMDLVYGFHAEETDSFVTNAMRVADSIFIASTPGAFYVDGFPFLKYLPEWFPGANFRCKAKEWNNSRVIMTETVFDVAKERIRSGNATSSFVSIALEQMDLTRDMAEQERNIKLASASAYGGEPTVAFANDCTSVVLEHFFAAMYMNPDVQSKAQTELDRVLGPGDLPSFSDEPLLPYITAIVWETLRFNPVAPLVPRLVTQDDVYEGYFIPKDTIVFANVWSIFHDEEEFPNPSQFDPSRFLDANGKLNPRVKDSTAAFGFGRRICPGRPIALASLFIAVASILTCYTIEPRLEEDGKPVKRRGDRSLPPSIFNRPPPFRYQFVPRSKKVEETLKRLSDC